MTIIQPEGARSILGVEGRAFNVVTWEGNGSAKAPRSIANQSWTSALRTSSEGRRVRVKLRFDDNCRNGHMSFGMTGESWHPKEARGPNGPGGAGGQIQDEIADAFPELIPLMQWHLCTTDGPLHYEANTIYHARDRDHHGLRAGERRQLVNGRTKLPVWQLTGPGGSVLPASSGDWVDALEAPPPILANWTPVWIEGKGKVRDLDAARRSAIWPEATDEQLMQEPEELRAMLRQRLPDLMARFKRAMTEDCGFLWRDPGQ